MARIYSAEEMKNCDEDTIKRLGISGGTLMERAGAALAEVLAADFDTTSVLILAGSGNNGGDGFALATLLLRKKISVAVLFVGNPDKRSKENLAKYEEAKTAGVPFVNTFSPEGVTAIVDAVFGIGLDRPLSEEMATLFAAVRDSAIPVLAVDIPSGICANTGEVMGAATPAQVTLTITAGKPGLYLHPGMAFCGKIRVADIGISCQSAEKNPPVTIMEKADVLSAMPGRRDRSNKGSYGRVLVVGGWVNMAGAAILSALAAYRTGAGLVEILSPEENRIIMQTRLPEAVFAGIDKENPDQSIIEAAVARADAVVVGPGLGKSGAAAEVVSFVLSSSRVSTVIDADAINLIAKMPPLLTQANAPLIFTPHLGEASRLLGRTIPDLAAHMPQAAKENAAALHAVLVLKDARTIVASPDGAWFINRFGNHGMAAGGAGDVLTGIIAGISAQGHGISPYEAACLGVALHGLAGDEARRKLGAYSLMATDIIDGISTVLRECAHA